MKMVNVEVNIMSDKCSAFTAYGEYNPQTLLNDPCEVLWEGNWLRATVIKRCDAKVLVKIKNNNIWVSSKTVRGIN